MVGAVLLGDTSTAGVLTQAFDRGTPLPADRLHLLFGGFSATAPAAELHDDDVVCTCNAVTAGALRGCADRGVRTVEDVAAQTRATTGCGTCTSSVRALLEAHRPIPVEV